MSDQNLQNFIGLSAVLTGLSRRVFEQGTVIACEGARLDTLQALLEEEERRHR